MPTIPAAGADGALSGRNPIQALRRRFNGRRSVRIAAIESAVTGGGVDVQLVAAGTAGVVNFAPVTLTHEEGEPGWRLPNHRT